MPSVAQCSPDCLRIAPDPETVSLREVHVRVREVARELKRKSDRSTDLATSAGLGLLAADLEVCAVALGCLRSTLREVGA